MELFSQKIVKIHACYVKKIIFSIEFLRLKRAFEIHFFSHVFIELETMKC